VIVVGDVNVSRKAFGRHMVFPLHASIQERCRLIGFDNLAPIIWYKIANAQYEIGRRRLLRQALRAQRRRQE
jgi:DNA modification methylase